MSELVWIAVPNGFLADGSSARLRVLISPRLTTTNLAEAGLANWPPPEISGARLEVEFRTDGNTPPMPPLIISPPHIVAEDGVWDRFFGGGIAVKPTGLREKRQVKDLQIVPTADLADRVSHAFVQAASMPVHADLDVNPELEIAVTSNLQKDWLQDPEPVLKRPSTAVGVPEPADFHRVLALLREHPAVLKSLGLIFEIDIPAAAIPRDGSAPSLRVTCADAPNFLPQIASPWTLYGPDFRPASSSTISSGMVMLTDDRVANGDKGWRIVTFDVDNGVERLRQAARKLDNGAGEAGLPTPRVTMPTLRSAGMMLVKKGRADDFANRRRAAAENAARASLEDVVLGADDLVIGYRIDVRDTASKGWQSLHQRRASYRVGGSSDESAVAGGAIVEEGHLKHNAAVDDGGDMLRADEVVARWDGWGLSVPRPAFDASEGARTSGRRIDNVPFQFSWDFAPVAGSLPRLRFSHSYSFRARVADVAGGGLSLDDPAAERCFTDRVPYLRYEPIASPEVTVPGEAPENGRLGPSETAHVVVIRSDRGMTVAAFAAANPGYGTHSRRNLGPPRASLALAEQHGALDDLDSEDVWERVHSAIAAAGRGAESTLPDVAAQGVRVFVRRDTGGFAAPSSDRPWTGQWPNTVSKRVELQERAAGQPATIGWQNGEGPQHLVVALPPAAQVTLDLSSFPVGEMMAHFALQPIPGASVDAFAAGRHPLVTPATAVTFTHAVRKPLRDPVGKLTAHRNPGETFTTLVADTPRLGVDPDSTAQVDIEATWTEFSDDQRVLQAAIPVQSVLLSRQDADFGVPIRHAFGDTKHRVIAYEATAVSRFRGYFDASEAPERFVARGSIGQSRVSIPSSVRPPAPILLSTRPSFLWEESGDTASGTIVRRRLGGRIRIELQRPWFQTGEGEKLAVIVWPNSESPPPLAFGFLSRVGADPIWRTDLPLAWLGPADFAGLSGEGGSVRLDEISDTVVALPFEPWFHDNRWYADVILKNIANLSYCPFVQLAVCRYQPESVVDDRSDRRLSPVVLTDMVQLYPDREVTVTRSSGRITVGVDGLGPIAPRRNRVDVILETSATQSAALTAHATSPMDAPAWQPVLNGIQHIELGGGTISLPLPMDQEFLRLRIREVELIGGPGASFPAQTGTADELTERVVFTDIVPLTP
ncbi:hypothetical protein [Pararhizobium gei]|uniref:hypothetical protein n=1 Tax=Pararhizobium gei TaxID=1395951 RepID=UPI0023DC2A30|nr:hypothetical protein [Rhizobium gei]